MIEQVGIALTGATAVWFSQSGHDDSRRWAPIFGLVGQPFWFYATWEAQQWGIFSVCIIYALAWVRGFINHWGNPVQRRVKAWLQSTR